MTNLNINTLQTTELARELPPPELLVEPPVVPPDFLPPDADHFKPGIIDRLGLYAGKILMPETIGRQEKRYLRLGAAATSMAFILTARYRGIDVAGSTFHATPRDAGNYAAMSRKLTDGTMSPMPLFNRIKDNMNKKRGIL